MARYYDDIVTDLEFLFIGPKSSRNSVQTSDKQVVRLDKKLCEFSPVLRQKFPDDPSLTSLLASENSVKDLLALHRCGVCPQNYPELLNLLATICELELGDWAQKFAEAIFGVLRTFLETGYPSECSIETIMHSFKLLLNSPLREDDIYNRQLARIAAHCDNNPGVMTKARELVSQRIEQLKAMNLEGLPVTFGKRVVPVAIFKSEGKLKTAVFDGEHLVHRKLLGDSFEIGARTLEDNFYLKYGSYLLYNAGDDVYLKNLRAETEPREILKGCTTLLTRGEFVFAVHLADGGYAVSRWMADEEFVEIYRTRKQIFSIDFHREARLMVLELRSGTILFFKLSENNHLSLLAEKGIPRLLSTILSKDRIQLLILKVYSEVTRQAWLQTYDVLRLCDSTTPDHEELVDQEYLKLIVRSAGDEVFFTRNGTLQIASNFPSLEEVRTLSDVAEKDHAVSELVIFS